MAIDGTDDWSVFTIEHEIQVWDSSWVSTKELENSPYSEDIASLKHAMIAVDVRTAIDDN